MKTVTTLAAGIVPSGTSKSGRTTWIAVSKVVSIAPVLLLAAGGILRAADAAEGYELVVWGGNPLPDTALHGITAMEGGGTFSLALKSDGSIFGWGWNGSGQASPPAGNDFVAIAASEIGWFSLALKSDGSIVGWGDSFNGQASPPPGNDFVAIAAGGVHGVALKSDGSVVAWGSNREGQTSTPAGNDFVAVAAGGGHSMALRIPPVVAPEILTEPVTQSADAGGSVTLSVEVSGTPAPNCQWQVDGVDIPGATALIYTIPSVQRFHAGDYTAIVTNAGGSVSSAAASLAVEAPPPSDARLLNLSTRGLSLTGDEVLIPGFVIQGSVPKRLLIRAVGPTLGKAPFNLSGVLENPRMALRKWNPTLPGYQDYAANDDWGTNANAAAITATAASLYAFGFNDAREAALLLDLPAGQYTVVTDGVDGGTGVAILELYDADEAAVDARLVNLSHRGFIGVGAEVMIPGFVVSSEGPRTFLIRVVGVELVTFNVPGTMEDPKLELYRREPNNMETLLLTNDDWGDNPDADYTAQIAAQVFAFALEPGSKDAALVVTLPPGVYTVVGSSADGVGTGVALVEVYVVP